MTQDDRNLESQDPDLTHVHDPHRTVVGEPAPGAPGKRKDTMRVSRRTIVGDTAVKLQAYVEISPPVAGAPGHCDLGTSPIVIGRNPDCGLQLDVDNVSRQHARIFYMQDEFYLEDLQSTNGTYVNGVEVSRCALRNSDLIEIGDAKIYFVEERVRE